MSLVLKNCVIYDAHSRYHSKKADVIVEKGFIQSIGTKLSAKQTFDLNGGWLSLGWIDLNAQFMDPGFEHKEDLKSGIRVAVGGGFTGVALSPNTHPVIESKGDIEYLLAKSGNPVDLLPIAALSEGTKGENMTEMLDLHLAGAVAFSDGEIPIWNSELLLKTLQYAQKFGGLIISRPRDLYLSRNAQMHEGKVSTLLGLRGEPSLSEKIQISNQLEILRYAGGRIHFSMVSSAEAVKLIRNAKKEGLLVTCDVGIHHLIFTDEQVEGFDTRYKIFPPFRTEQDRKALIKGVNEGTIDAIVSGHTPQDRESKYLEFDLAEQGVTSLQTVFSVLISLQKELNLDRAMDALTAGPRRILGLEKMVIEEGSKANLSMFDPKSEWTLNDRTNLSKSRNSPFWGKKLMGKSLGIVNGTKVEITS